ncbi:MAG: hypothetical protein JWO94_2280 [Verrucomicrobiaceae bacterium]|nr:hypothetical protein [Verrucomicrobiaceae bacterium]
MRTLIISLPLILLVSSLHAQAHRQLFLDPASVHEVRHASLHVNPAQQREVIIRPDKPWEQLTITFFSSVIDDNGKLRLWYVCRDKDNQPNVAYAESTDGIQWTKPSLGIVDYHGSKDNNLVGMTSLEGNVFKDPNASPQERYCYITHLMSDGIIRFHSPDGLHWQRDAKALIPLGADTQNVTLWDPNLGKYAIYLRGWFKRDKKPYRHVVRGELQSTTTPLAVGPSEKSYRPWGKDKIAVIGDELPTVFEMDEHDPAETDVYNIAAVLYPLDTRWYLGFPSVFQHEGHPSKGRLEPQFTGSCDGIHWQRYDRQAYAPLGLAGSDNENMIFMSTGMAIRGDEIWQYGTGLRTKHGDMESRKLRTDGIIYRYVQRVDGFVSLDFDLEGGQATTAPVTVEDRLLQINLDTGAMGSLRIALLDEQGKVIPGFTAEDSIVMHTNATHATASWKGGDDLSALKGHQIQLQLTGTRCKVFSYFFNSPR